MCLNGQRCPTSGYVLPYEDAVRLLNKDKQAQALQELEEGDLDEDVLVYLLEHWPDGLPKPAQVIYIDEEVGDIAGLGGEGHFVRFNTEDIVTETLTLGAELMKAVGRLPVWDAWVEVC